MYTRESVSTDRYAGDDETHNNTTAVSSDWSVRPSDDMSPSADTTQLGGGGGLSRLNPAAAPFSFAGGGDIAPGPPGPAPHNVHPHPHHHGSSSGGSGSLMDGGVSGSNSGGAGPGLMHRGGSGAGGVLLQMDGGHPAAYGAVRGGGGGGGMSAMGYGGGGSGGPRGHGMSGRPAPMMDYSPMHGSGMGGPGRMGGMGGPGLGGGGMGPINGFLPPPGEDTDHQELLRLQQTNYRVKMLPPPLTYEVHRRIWARNEYGEGEDDGGDAGDDLNEEVIDKAQRLEAYKQIMLRWYAHIHVLEGKPEVAKRLVRVRRSCPSMEEVIAALRNPAAAESLIMPLHGSDMGEDEEDDAVDMAPPPPPPPPASAAHRSPGESLDPEVVLSTWSARCWEWWQETGKRKPRRARKPVDGGPVVHHPGNLSSGLPTSASAPMMSEGGVAVGLALPHSLSTRMMDGEGMSPTQLSRNGGSPYAHGGGGGYTGAAMPTAPSYTSFTDMSEEGPVDSGVRSYGQNQQLLQQSSRNGSYSAQQMPPMQQQQQQQASAAMFTTNGARVGGQRSGNPEDYLENDHLTLAFTTELLKSLED